MNKNKKIIIAATAITLLAAAAGFKYGQYLDEQEHAALALKNQHGEGKKQLDCDMSQLVINYHGEDSLHPVDSIINLEAEKYLHDGKGSNKMKRSLVMPMSELIKNYADATAVEFIPCGSDKTESISVESIQQDPSNYLITFNNRKRARLAIYKQSNSGSVKYHTAVKNLYRIIIK